MSTTFSKTSLNEKKNKIGKEKFYEKSTFPTLFTLDLDEPFEVSRLSAQLLNKYFECKTYKQM